MSPIRNPSKRRQLSDKTRTRIGCSWCTAKSLIFALALVLVPLFPSSGVAQALYGGARSSALGNASTALSDDAWASSNPAVWGTMDGRAVSFFASQSFGLSELQLSSVQYVEPTPFATLAAGVSTFGYTDFRETNVHIGIARSLSFGSTRRVLVGVRAGYGQIAIPSYGSRNTFSLSVGSLVVLSDVLDFGFAVENLVASSVSQIDDPPRSLSSGIMYQASDQFRVVADARQESGYPLELRGGIEFFPVEILVLRVGAASQPSRISGGMGISLGYFSIELAVQNHDVLGLTPAGGLSVLW